MRSFTKFCIILTLLFVFAGCTARNTTSTAQEPAENRQATYQEPDYYMDFDDIMIPKEINYDADNSYKLDNSKFRAAIMRFTGRVQVMELINYFLNNMTKDNWTLVSNNKASTVHVMTFEKYNKSCVIQVDDSFATAKTTIFAVEVKGGTSLKDK